LEKAKSKSLSDAGYGHGEDDPSLPGGESEAWVPYWLYCKMMWRLKPRLSRYYFRRLRGILAMSVNHTRERNQGLLNASLAMRDLIELGKIDEAIAVELLLDTARLNGYVIKHGKVRGVKRALRTIHSGLDHKRGIILPR
jgi:hypothetical protein